MRFATDCNAMIRVQIARLAEWFGTPPCPMPHAAAYSERRGGVADRWVRGGGVAHRVVRVIARLLSESVEYRLYCSSRTVSASTFSGEDETYSTGQKGRSGRIGYPGLDS